MKAKLVKESLYEGAQYPELMAVAKELEKRLSIKLEPQENDNNGYLGYELEDGETEAMGIGFDVIDSRIPKKSQRADYPFALCLDTNGGFQFWEESTPIVTRLNSEAEKREAWQSLIPNPKPVKKLTPEIYQEALETYLEGLDNIA